MRIDHFIQFLHNSAIIEDMKITKKSLEDMDKTEIKSIPDPRWKKAMEFYDNLAEEDKENFFTIIEQTNVDALSNILGIIDGVVTITTEDMKLELKLNGKAINGDLQDLFLAYDEDSR